MRKTDITILGEVAGEDYRRLERALALVGLRSNAHGAHLRIRMTGTSHDPDLLISNSPIGTGLRSLLTRSKCCIMSESDPGNGRAISGLLVCRAPDVSRETGRHSLLSYTLDPKTGRYEGISTQIAARIEALRDMGTRIDGVPVREWLLAGLTELTGELRSGARVMRPLQLTDPLPPQAGSPLVLGKEHRVHPESAWGLSPASPDESAFNP